MSERAYTKNMPVGSKDDEVLYVGIDLGTSRIAVAGSNGIRAKDWSYVGYPKDMVSMKLLGKRVVFGKEALEKRLSVELLRPFEKGAIKFTREEDAPREQLDKNLQAAKELVKYAVGLAQPRPDQLVYGVIGMPAEASIHNKTTVIDAARDALDAVMVCSEPFAVAYGLDRLDDTLVVDIGAGTIDLCRMHGTMPAAEDQITITTAGDWLDDQILEAFRKKAPEADFTIHKVREVKNKYAFVSDTGQPVMVEFVVDGKPTVYDVTQDLRDACRKLIPPITKIIRQLIASFDPDFQEKLRENVILGGGGSQIIGLGGVLEEHMTKHLGSGRVMQVEEPVYAGCNGALKIAHDMPREFWKQLSERQLPAEAAAAA